MKQETLEETAENYGWRIKRNTFSDAVKANELAESAKQDFINGAKWQQKQVNKELAMWKLAVEKQESRCESLRQIISGLQERSYSEEYMAESFMACWKANVPEGFECKLSFNELFEQFKKKII